MKRSLLALAMLLGAGAALAESAVTVRPAEMQADAQSDARTLGTVPTNARIEILNRKGAWCEVRTANGQRGWVRSDTLKPEAASQGAAPAAGALDKLLTSGRTANTATVTTGVRGLPREDQEDGPVDADDLQRAREFESDKAATH
ncbi:MAG TPA: SH3 domain-containing protein [Noviherbaspirillum sp.]|nr:SH3 domain-containing protein [Noviherbaspirillum sp.]